MDNKVYFVDDSWNFVKYTVNFKNFTITYAQKGGYKTKEDAEKEKMKADLNYQKDLEKIKKIANARYTFKEYVMYWLDECFLPNTDTSTKSIGNWAIRNLILPNIRKDILLSYITADYVNDIIETCIPICYSAGETVCKYLRKIVYDAYAQGFLSRNIKDELMNAKRKKPNIILLSKQELSLLLKEASKHPAFYFEILLALFVGLRSGEIMGLRYGDFEEKAHTVRISRQYTTNYTLAESNDHYELVYTMEEKNPKANSSRLLKIPEFIFEELEKKKAHNQIIIQNLKKKGRTDLDEDYISISQTGHRKRKGTLASALKRTCNQAGIRRISLHSLRHHFATMLLEQDMPLETISKLLGHKNVLTTFNIYVGIIDANEDTSKALDTLLPMVTEG
ncbi:site-specific integrase [Coprococcus catus]